MWKRILAILAAIGLLAVLGGAVLVAYIAVGTVKPDLVNHDLRREFAFAGLTVGESTMQDVLATFGVPQREYREPLSLRYEYPSKGLLLRIGVASGRVEWYEFSSSQYATAKGVKVGAPFTAVTDAYGKPSSVTPLASGTRVRYHYGIAYTLEFWLDRDGKLARVAFFKS